MNGFMTFLREQGVMGLAVGFILGGAVSELVSALVSDLISPFLGLLLGAAEGLTQSTLKIGSVELLTGHFLATLLDFIVVAAVVYYLVKGLGFDKLDKAKK